MRTIEEVYPDQEGTDLLRVRIRYAHGGCEDHYLHRATVRRDLMIEGLVKSGVAEGVLEALLEAHDKSRRESHYCEGGGCCL